MSQLKNPAPGPPLRGAGCRHDTGVMETQRIMRQDIKNSLIPLCIPLSSYFSPDIKYDLISLRRTRRDPRVPISLPPIPLSRSINYGSNCDSWKNTFFQLIMIFLIFPFSIKLAYFLDFKKLKIHENGKMSMDSMMPVFKDELK